MTELTINRCSVDFYANLLDNNVPFALSRWGDGEWMCALNRRGQNCDGHQYFPDLAVDLRRALKRRWGGNFFYAIGPQATRQLLPEIENFINAHELGKRVWHRTDTFVEASIAGDLYPLIKALRARRVVYVGPDHLHRRQTVADLFPVVAYVPIPERNAYLSRAGILTDLRRAVEKTQPDAIGFSAGMLSNVLIDRLWNEAPSRRSLIDFGSIWDPYVNVVSRSYHQRHDWLRLRQLNTGEL